MKRFAEEVKRVRDYETRIERANAALQAAPDAKAQFQVFAALPQSVQRRLWDGDLSLHADPDTHDARVVELEASVATDENLHAMLNGRQGGSDSDSDSTDTDDVSFDTLREGYRAHRRDLRDKRARRRCISDKVIYEAAIEHVTRDAPVGLYPAKAADVDGWRDFLMMQMK
jgi:hypothetical protein